MHVFLTNEVSSIKLLRAGSGRRRPQFRNDVALRFRDNSARRSEMRCRPECGWKLHGAISSNFSVHYSTTVAENIGMGDLRLTKDRTAIEAAAHAVGAVRPLIR